MKQFMWFPDDMNSLAGNIKARAGINVSAESYEDAIQALHEALLVKPYSIDIDEIRNRFGNLSLSADTSFRELEEVAGKVILDMARVEGE